MTSMTLKQKRESLNLTLDDVESRTGIAVSQIEKYETGEVDPRGSGRGNLANAYGVTVFDIDTYLKNTQAEAKAKAEEAKAEAGTPDQQ